MSNLGAYQTVTTGMKLLGGPKKAIPIVLIGTIVTWEVLKKGVSIPCKILKSKSREAENLNLEILTVVNDGKYQNLTLRPGDQFSVLEIDGDSVLIFVYGDSNNPYVVPAEFILQLVASNKGAIKNG